MYITLLISIAYGRYCTGGRCSTKALKHQREGNAKHVSGVGMNKDPSRQSSVTTITLLHASVNKRFILLSNFPLHRSTL